jgi:hypothetical protein
MEWYYYILQMLSALTEPISQLYYAQEAPIMAAFFLGVLGAVAPCQLTANMGVISYSLHKISRGERWYGEMLFFFLGKTAVYVILALLAFALGKTLEQWIIPVAQVSKRLMGPIFLLTGLYLIGFIKLRGLFTERLLKFKPMIEKLNGHKRGFLLGILISLAFCPTMFLLFFAMLIPLVLQAGVWGGVLPLTFSIGTFLPVLIFLALAFGFGLDGTLIRRSKRIGRIIQAVAGIILLVVGINDIIIYWTM